jgi:endonuclease YncB( thermonuclease family)
MKNLRIGVLLPLLGLVMGCRPSDLALIFYESPIPESRLAYVVPGSVVDGDTFRVRYFANNDIEREEQRIRLCGIDAPESDQPLGPESGAYLEDILGEADYTTAIVVVPIETDQYGRTIAEVYVPQGDDAELFVNGEMMRAGLAYHYERYSDTCPNHITYDRFQEMAQEANAGVWALPNAVLPWDHRRQQREGQ